MRILLIGLSLFTPGVVFALSLGSIAENLLEPVSILADFVNGASLIIGVCLLFASFFRYMRHRVNPLAAPISTVVVLLILGIVLLFLPLAYELTGSKISPYSLSQQHDA